MVTGDVDTTLAKTMADITNKSKAKHNPSARTPKDDSMSDLKVIFGEQVLDEFNTPQQSVNYDQLQSFTQWAVQNNIPREKWVEAAAQWLATQAQTTPGAGGAADPLGLR